MHGTLNPLWEKQDKIWILLLRSGKYTTNLMLTLETMAESQNLLKGPITEEIPKVNVINENALV